MNQWENESGVTVGELMEQLEGYASDTPVCFGPHGHFRFKQVKDRGICHIEFNEIDGQDYELLPDHPYLEYFKALKLGKK